MANNNSKFPTNIQNKDFKNSDGTSDFSSAFWSSVKKYRFTSITILLIVLYFVFYYAKNIFG